MTFAPASSRPPERALVPLVPRAALAARVDELLELTVAGKAVGKVAALLGGAAAVWAAIVALKKRVQKLAGRGERSGHADSAGSDPPVR